MFKNALAWLVTTLDRTLVPDWREAWRWWSVQLQAVYAVLAALFADGAMIALGLAGVTSSDRLRITLMIAVGLMWFVPAIVARLHNQGEAAEGHIDE
jgi:hypothetical protein